MKPIKEILKGLPKYDKPPASPFGDPVNVTVAEQTLTLKPGNLWYPAAELRGVEYINICIWYDYTFVPKRGHHGDCKWKFDGQIWRHL